MPPPSFRNLLTNPILLRAKISSMDDMDDFSSRFMRTIKTGKGKSHTYYINDRCKICQAEDEEGESVRLKIDKLLTTKGAAEVIKELIYKYGIIVTAPQIKNHIDKHSPYITEIKKHLIKVGENTALSKIEDLEDTYVDPDRVIEDIITIGAGKIKTGEMEVDSKLLLGALREDRERKKSGSLRELMEGMDKIRFGVIIPTTIDANLIEEPKDETTKPTDTPRGL